ncbi:protein-tyrosine phosphatase-like protein [Zopfochytrium polystomum]|nr:protein-tyrosine phosphatase-like protein [Zopfochytrium polystomum]
MTQPPNDAGGAIADLAATPHDTTQSTTSSWSSLSAAYREALATPMNHVFHFRGPPQLYIGNLAAALDRDLLRAHNITRVVQVLEEDWSPFRDDGIAYLPIVVADAAEGVDLLSWFGDAVKFVLGEAGGRDGGGEDSGNVLVHCQMGSSRSGAVAAALLVWRAHVGWRRAVEMAREARACWEKQVMDQTADRRGETDSRIGGSSE